MKVRSNQPASCTYRNPFLDLQERKPETSAKLNCENTKSTQQKRQRKATTVQPISKPTQSQAVKPPDNFDPLCRICLEGALGSKIIMPCECTGTIAGVHDGCLKTWIRIRFETLEGAFCELCKYKYRMTFNQRHKFTPIRSWKEAFSFFSWFFGTIFLSLLCIYLIKWLIYNRMLSTQNGALMLLFFLFTLFLSPVVIVYQTFFKEKIDDWVIYEAKI